MPREGRFFELFDQHAAHVAAGSRCLAALMANYANLEARQDGIEAIDREEKDADRITHDTVQLLHKTFITPLDRDQIHNLITTMDDILDLMEDAAQCINLYDIRAVTPDARALADIGVQCCDRLHMVVSLLHNLNDTASIMKICEEIDRLESDADRVMRRGMGRLFRDEADTRQLIKMKAIYELLEEITDKCEDVANLIEGIVLENA